MSAILQRHYFQIPHESRYFSVDGLRRMIGHEPNQWRHAALKELVDNGLDAAESVHPATAPTLTMDYTETAMGLLLAIADNGPGLNEDTVRRLADFSQTGSSKIGYRAPLRGAMGNALKTLMSIPIALGCERGGLIVDSRGQRHRLEIRSTAAGVKVDHQQAAIDFAGTRFVVSIPGDPDCYYWNPERWALSFALFNPHARLQIRKNHGLVWEFPDVFHNDRASDSANDAEFFADAANFSDFSPTVDFPVDKWRKYLPTDSTPVHWYSEAEFKALVEMMAVMVPDQPIGGFVQEFRGLSRGWRPVAKTVAVKHIGALADDPAAIRNLHNAMRNSSVAPRPEVLGRVGEEHFRRGFDQAFTVHDRRFWYKHQWGVADGMPYLIECAIAETDQPGEVFYGLNYSVPFADPLAETRLTYAGAKEPITGHGLGGFLQEAGVYCGERYGRPLNTVAAVHIVMPLLPTLDMGKSRLAVSPPLAEAVATVVGTAAKTLHKEIVQHRINQRRVARKVQERRLAAAEAQAQLEERQQRAWRADREKAHKRQVRELKQAERAAEAERRQARNQLPTKKEVLWELFLPCYLSETDGEKIRIMSRDFFYVVRPPYNRHEVRPTKMPDGTDSVELIYSTFSQYLTNYRRDSGHKLPMIDYKARGTLFESHSGRELPMGDRELRNYQLPRYEYAGILFIEKEGVWQTLKDTGGIELVRAFDLMVLSSEGYSTEAVRNFMAMAATAGYQLFAWHDADPHGYNICRTLGEPTERMPDHHLDIIDLGLTIEEGLAMGLQTETFTRKKEMPAGILPNLTDQELEFFTGESWEIGSGKKARHEWRNCQRIEINAIPVRDRVGYLERKLNEAIQRRPTADDAVVAASAQPAFEEIQEAASAMLLSRLKIETRTAIEERLNLKQIEAAALADLPKIEVDRTILQTALKEDKHAPWRTVLKRLVGERLDDSMVKQNLTGTVDNAIRQALGHWLT